MCVNMNKLKSFGLSSILLFSILIFIISAPSALYAVTYDDLMEPFYQDYKFQKVRGHFPNNANGFRNPSEVDNTASIHSWLTALKYLGAQPTSGFQKKWDTLSGGSFGLQKRTAESIPLSEVKNFVVERAERDHIKGRNNS